MKTTNKIFAAMGVGMAAGAVLGLMFAPRKGSETRKILSKKGTKLTGTIKNEIHEGPKKLNGLKEGFRDGLNHINKTVEKMM
jgi:gas vesicle protein